MAQDHISQTPKLTRRIKQASRKQEVMDDQEMKAIKINQSEHQSEQEQPDIM